MTRASRPFLALALAGLCACGTAEAVVAPPVPAPPPAAQRPAAPTDEAATLAALPDVVGMDVSAARERLAAEGAAVSLVAFDGSPTVSAQFPSRGEVLPSDGTVTLWTGAPPAPPPPTPAALSAEPVVATDPATDVESAPAVRTEPVEVEDQRANAPQPAPAIVVGATPTAAPYQDADDPEPPQAWTGSSAVRPSHAPRTSPRLQPAGQAGLRLEGPASWYGPGFEGRTTACGGAFDPDQLTLASRELRCGTRVLVTGPGGASVEAIVTDWGPAEWTDRRFDLSRATFAAIAHLGAGEINVTVELR